MSESPEDLNFQFNYNQFMAKTLTNNLRSVHDKNRVYRWLRKLALSNRYRAEMRIRNEFMNHLLKDLQAGVINPPFRDPPPAGPLPTFASMLPGGLAGLPEPTINTEDRRANERTTEKTEHRRPPDGGAFLVPQPSPQVGAFCYLSVIAKR